MCIRTYGHYKIGNSSSGYNQNWTIDHISPSFSIFFPLGLFLIEFCSLCISFYVGCGKPQTVKINGLQNLRFPLRDPRVTSVKRSLAIQILVQQMQPSERFAVSLNLIHDPHLLEHMVDLVQCNCRPEWTQCPGFLKHLTSTNNR